MKPSKLYEALHALIGERVPLHIWGACGVGKRLCQSVWDCTIGKHQNHRVNSKRPIRSRPILIGGESMYKGSQSTSECSNDETIGKCGKVLRSAQGPSRTHFVTGLCQDLKMMTIMTDLHFTESISYVD